MSSFEQIGSSGVYRVTPTPTGAAGAKLNVNFTALVTKDAAIQADLDAAEAAIAASDALIAAHTASIAAKAPAAQGVASASGTAPLTLSFASNALTGSVAAASGSAPGSMSAAHYSLLNNATPNRSDNTIVKRDNSGNIVVDECYCFADLSTEGDLFVEGAITCIGGNGINGTFFGDGAFISGIDAANIATGTVADARLSANVPLKNAANTFSSSVAANGLTTSGTFAAKVVVKTANYTLSTTETVVLVNAASGAVTITLPAASGCADRQYTVKKIDNANNVVIARTGSDTIDGATSVTISTQYEALTFTSSGTNWFII